MSSFNNWIPRGLFNEQGTPIYSNVRSRGTKFAEELIAKLARQPENEHGERPMLVPPPLPRKRNEV
jgi:hypothetical protein